MRKYISIIGGVVILAIAIIIAMTFIKNKKKKKPQADKITKMVFVQTVQNKTIPLIITTSGNLKAKNKITLFSEVQGVLKITSKDYKAGTNYRKGETILSRMGKSLENEDLADVKALIEELGIGCPVSGSKNWTDIKQFNLMFGTKLGASADTAIDLYLRPETAQGIFVNVLNVQKSGRMKIPFGIAQTGKAFRNEIVARQFIFRMREFEQMEMQFFVRPGTQKEWYEQWKQTRFKWHLSLGLGEDNYRFHDHEKLAHYADAATDIEFRFPFGFKELEGIHSRTDFDLSAHQEDKLDQDRDRSLRSRFSRGAS